MEFGNLEEVELRTCAAVTEEYVESRIEAAREAERGYLAMEEAAAKRGDAEIQLAACRMRRRCFGRIRSLLSGLIELREAKLREATKAKVEEPKPEPPPSCRHCGGPKAAHYEDGGCVCAMPDATPCGCPGYEPKFPRPASHYLDPRP